MDPELPPKAARIAVRDLTMAYGNLVVMRDLNFEIQDKDIFTIIGGSGCGKSTLLRHLIGLLEPARGSILYDGDDLTSTDPAERGPFIRRFGVMASILTWKLQPVTGKETRTRYFHITVPTPATPDTMTGRVTAMNQALELLARQIARQW